MYIERISKTYYSSSSKDSVSVVIPKSIRDVIDISAGNYVKWTCIMEDGEIKISLSKI